MFQAVSRTPRGVILMVEQFDKACFRRFRGRRGGRRGPGRGIRRVWESASGEAEAAGAEEVAPEMRRCLTLLLANRMDSVFAEHPEVCPSLCCANVTCQEKSLALFGPWISTWFHCAWTHVSGRPASSSHVKWCLTLVMKRETSLLRPHLVVAPKVRHRRFRARDSAT